MLLQKHLLLEHVLIWRAKRIAVLLSSRASLGEGVDLPQVATCVMLAVVYARIFIYPGFVQSISSIIFPS
jgi:hypothetical protein